MQLVSLNAQMKEHFRFTTITDIHYGQKSSVGSLCAAPKEFDDGQTTISTWVRAVIKSKQANKVNVQYAILRDNTPGLLSLPLRS